MKSEIMNDPKVKLDYPCLKIYQFDGEKTIVLFNDEKAGVVVYSNNDNDNLGDYSTTWAENDFENFNGKLELFN